jgi:hypothetical protein
MKKEDRSQPSRKPNAKTGIHKIRLIKVQKVNTYEEGILEEKKGYEEKRRKERHKPEQPMVKEYIMKERKKAKERKRKKSMELVHRVLWVHELVRHCVELLSSSVFG